MTLEFVYECWVGDKAESFCKLYSRTEVELWVRGQLLNCEFSDRIHIVVHSPDEYYVQGVVV